MWCVLCSEDYVEHCVMCVVCCAVRTMWSTVWCVMCSEDYVEYCVVCVVQ